MAETASADQPATADPIRIDLWVWNLVPAEAEITRLSALLSDAERTRANRFLSPKHGASYVAGRGRLREILSEYVNSAPEQHAFTYGTAGKPELSGRANAPSFNLSHTGDWAALVVTAGHSLGVDIEAMRPLKEDIAERFFSPAEVAALNAHPMEARVAAFYRCWTRKEAFVKATGDGLGFPLDAFDVSIAADAKPAFLRIAGQSALDLARWRLLHLDEPLLAPGILGAIAIKADTAGQQVVLRPRT